MQNIFSNIRNYGGWIFFGLVLLAIGIGCILTAQWFLGGVVLIITALFAVAFHYLDTHGPETANQGEWVMIASGVIVAVMATTIAPWLVWAVNLAVLFLLLLVLARIEKRLAMLEYRSTRRILRRRTRGGAGPRHRA